LARDLLVRLIESDPVLLISDEMLYELAKVLRYPRMMALHGLLSSTFLLPLWLMDDRASAKGSPCGGRCR
jgi:hypothetical protein